MMSFQDTLAAVAGTLRLRAEKRAATFTELLDAIDSGKAPRPDVIADILESAGKTAQDLAESLQLRQQRREWRTQVDRVAVCEQELRDIQVERDRTNAAYHAKLAELKREQLALQNGFDERTLTAQQAINVGTTARVRLLETSGLIGEIREVTAVAVAENAEVMNHQFVDWLSRQLVLTASIEQTERTLRNAKPSEESEMRQRLAGYVSELEYVERHITTHRAASESAASEAAELEAKALQA